MQGTFPILTVIYGKSHTIRCSGLAPPMNLHDRIPAWRKQLSTWSSTIPTACMNA